jgi:cellulose synthase/poly-beta-1,6-N-acetylglucosamine synthase-like glycosyltransferase
MTVLSFAIAIAATPFLAAAGYLAFLSLLSWPRPRRSAGTPAGRVRFDVVVPAHNEETEIEATVRSLLTVDYPRHLYRVLIVADNCTDGTAAVAERAGATVLVRTDPDRRGKGYALAFAVDRSLADELAAAVVVIDADTVVSRNLLQAFAARLERGASVLQARYGVRDAAKSWRTRMMAIALGAFHDVRSVGRERLGASCGLRGNGMAFTIDTLRRLPPAAFSIVEDLEYGLQLAYGGIRVQYVHEASVAGHMAATDEAATSQRQRWEGGRRALIRAHTPRLLAETWRQRSPWLLDLLADLLVPPLAHLVVWGVTGLIASVLVASVVPSTAPWLWIAGLAALLLHVLRGWSYSGSGLSGLIDLLRVPGYIVWKLKLRIADRGQVPVEWVRTKREGGR